MYRVVHPWTAQYSKVRHTFSNTRPSYWQKKWAIVVIESPHKITQYGASTTLSPYSDGEEIKSAASNPQKKTALIRRKTDCSSDSKREDVTYSEVTQPENSFEHKIYNALVGKS